MIRNFLEQPMEKTSIHGGQGLCDHCSVFTAEDFDAPLRFINYTVVPVGGNYGLHKHGNDNEVYVLLEGEGEYTQDGVTEKVKTGDIMLNAPYAVHAIANTGMRPMRLLIFEAYNRE